MTAKRLLDSTVLWESVVLSLMCLVDAYVTICVVWHGWAIEANPIMAFFLNRGIPVFVFAKIALFLPGIIACEYLRHHNPRFAVLAMRFGTVGYLLVYVIGDLRINNVI